MRPSVPRDDDGGENVDPVEGCKKDTVGPTVGPMLSVPRASSNRGTNESWNPAYSINKCLCVFSGIIEAKA
jgi:hypothetical protein